LRLPQDATNVWARVDAPGTRPFVLITIEVTDRGMAFFAWNGTVRRTFDGGWWRLYGNLAERCLDETGDLLYQMKMVPCNVPELPPLK